MEQKAVLEGKREMLDGTFVCGSQFAFLCVCVWNYYLQWDIDKIVFILPHLVTGGKEQKLIYKNIPNIGETDLICIQNVQFDWNKMFDWSVVNRVNQIKTDTSVESDG